MKEDIIRGSGNVYQDLKIPDADVRQFKAILAAEIIKTLDKKDLTVRKAQGLTGVPTADFSRIRTADLERFTSDRLMMILNKLGSRVEVSVKVKERKREARAEELIDEKFLSLFLKEMRAAQRRIERSIDATIASCEASNARIERLARRVSDRYDASFAKPIGTGSNLRANEALLSRAMKITGHRSRRAVIDEALRMLIRINRQAAVRKLKDRIHFDTDKGSGHEKTRGQ